MGYTYNGINNMPSPNNNNNRADTTTQQPIVSAIGQYSQPDDLIKSAKTADSTINAKDVIDDYNRAIKANQFIVLDTETLGDIGTSDFFATTEVAMNIKNNTQRLSTEIAHSKALVDMPVQPGKQMANKLSSLIDQIANTEKGENGLGYTTFMLDNKIRGLSDTEYRSLTSLMHYSDSSVFSTMHLSNGVSFKTINPNKSVSLKGGARTYGSSLGTAEAITQMKAGLANITNKEYAYSANETVEKIMAYVQFAVDPNGTMSPSEIQDNIKRTSLVYANGKKFDDPVIDALAKNTVAGKTIAWKSMRSDMGRFDIQETIRTLFGNPFEQIPNMNVKGAASLVQMFKGGAIEGGAFRIENLYKFMKFDKKIFHFAGEDTEATGSIMDQLWGKIQSRMGNLTSEDGMDGLHVNMGKLKYGKMKDGIVSGGDVFFARAGVGKTNGINGMIFDIGEKGKLSPVNTHGSTPIYKNTYYKALGFDTVNIQDPNVPSATVQRTAFAMYNMDDNTVHYMFADENSKKYAGLSKEVKEKAQRNDIMNAFYNSMDYLPNKYTDKQSQHLSSIDDNINSIEQELASKKKLGNSSFKNKAALNKLEAKKYALIQDKKSFELEHPLFNGVNPKVQENRLDDIAMRRYRKMFDASNRAGGGYNLWKQNYGALDVLNDFKTKMTNQYGISNLTQKQVLDIVNGDFNDFTDLLHQGYNSNIRVDKAAQAMLDKDTLEKVNGIKNIASQSKIGIQQSFSTNYVTGKTYEGGYSSSKLRDLIHMSDILETERPFYESFTESVSSSNPNTLSVALSRFHHKVVDTFATGEQSRYALEFENQIPIFNPNGKIIDGMGDKIKRSFVTFNNMSEDQSISSIASGLRGIINQSAPTNVSGSIGMNINRQKRTTTSIIKDLRTQGTLSRKDANGLINQLEDNVTNSSMLNQWLPSLAQKISDNYDGNGKHNILRIPTGKPLYDLSNYSKKSGSKLAADAYSEANILMSQNKYSTDVQKIFNVHNKAVEDKTLRIKNSWLGADINAGETWHNYDFDNIKNMEESIAGINKNFNKQNFNTQLIASKKDGVDTLTLVAYNKEVANEMMSYTSTDELLQSKNIIKVNIPTLDKNGIMYGTAKQPKVNQYILDIDEHGKLKITTTYDKIIEEISSRSRYATQMLSGDKTNGSYNASKYISTGVQQRLNEISGANERYGSPSDIIDNMKVGRYNPANIQKADLINYKSPSVIKAYARDMSKSSQKNRAYYENIMNMASPTVDDLTLKEDIFGFDNWVMQRNLNGHKVAGQNIYDRNLGNFLHMGSLKENEGVKHFGSITDVRRYIPFGQYSDTTTQRFRQGMLVMPLDIAAAPKESQAWAAKVKNRTRIITQSTLQDYGEQSPGYMLNMAEMTDSDIKARFEVLAQEAKHNTDPEFQRKFKELQESVGKLGLPSTYEGQFVLGKTAAGAYTSTDVKRYVVNEDFVFTKQGLELYKGDGIIGEGLKDRITVGGIAKNANVSLTKEEYKVLKSKRGTSRSAAIEEKIFANSGLDIENTNITQTSIHSKRGQYNISVQYVDSNAQDSLNYTGRYGGKLSTAIGKNGEPSIIEIAQKRTTWEQGIKFGTTDGEKVTARTLSDGAVELLAGREGIEGIINPVAKKKKSYGEIFKRHTTMGIDAIANSNASTEEKDAAIMKIRGIIADVNGEKSAADIVGGITGQGRNIIINDATQTTVGNLAIGQKMDSVSEIVRGLVGNKSFNNIFGKEWKDVNGNTRYTKYTTEEVIRTDVAEWLHSTGSLNFSENKAMINRSGVWKIGNKELLAVKTASSMDGKTLTNTAKWLNETIKVHSAYQKPELGAYGNNQVTYFNTKTQRYMAGLPGELSHDTQEAMMNGEVIMRPSRSRTLRDVITGDRKGVMVGIGTSPIASLADESSLPLINDENKNFVVSNSLFTNVLKSNDVGGPLTSKDYEGTIFDIQHVMSFNKDIPGYSDLTKATRQNLQAVKERINHQGGFWQELVAPVNIKNGEDTKTVDKIWVTLEQLVSYGKNDDKENLITAGKLNKYVISVANANQKISNMNHNVYADDITTDEQKRNAEKRAYDELQRSVQGYQDTAFQSLTGKGGSISERLSAKIENSGQFRAQFVSPAEMARSGLEEGSIGIGAEDFGALTKGMSKEDLELIEGIKAKEGGVYALSGRYPTLSSKSIQAMKVTTVDGLTNNTAMITPGALLSMAGDADGDWVSLSLAMYNSNTYTKQLGGIGFRKDVINEMNQFGKAMAKDLTPFSNKLYTEMEDNVKKLGFSSIEQVDMTMDDVGRVIRTISNTGSIEDKKSTVNMFLDKMKEKDITVGREQVDTIMNLVSGNSDFSTDFQKNLTETISNTAKVHPYNTSVFNIQDEAARWQRKLIGNESNASYKIRNIAQSINENSATSVFSKSELINLEDLTRGLEQNVISSKHMQLALSDLTAGKTPEEALELTQNYVNNMLVTVQDITKAVYTGDKEQFKTLNKQLGGVIQNNSWTNTKSAEDIIDDGFATINKIQNLVDVNHKGLNKIPGLQLGGSGLHSTKDINDLLNNATVVTPEVEEFFTSTGEGAKLQGVRDRLNDNINKATTNGIFNGGADGILGDTEETVGTIAKETITNNLNKVHGGGVKAGALAFAALWAASAFVRTSPAQRAQKDNTNGEVMQPQQSAATNGSVLPYIPQANISSPTARVEQNTGGYQNLNINVKASNTSDMNNNEIIAMIQQELQNQSPIKMDVNAKSTDNTTNVNKQWVNDIVSRSTRFGMGF